ncbi:MAG TPA: lysophospholipid acyltransferase family protein [Pyrinomonadaceae bacterium]|jgi:lysophospholipid acyltransferase (LPLAT)-like uncharacterized protein
MDEKIQQVFKPADLSAYSVKQRLIIRLADWAFYLLIAFVAKTVKIETEGTQHYEAIEKSGKLPIICFWHNRIFLGTYFHRDRRIVVITSQSFDGEYIARFIQRFGFGAIRGSSTRGGVGALVEMIRLMKNGLATAFSIDGPKGPRYVAKSGACLLAKKTGNPIVPFLVEAEKFWELKSWDRLQIPKPFTRARFFYAAPIYVAPDADDGEIERKRAELQASLDELVARGEKWRESLE